MKKMNREGASFANTKRYERRYPIKILANLLNNRLGMIAHHYLLQRECYRDILWQAPQYTKTQLSP